MLRYTKYCAMALFMVAALCSVFVSTSNAAEQAVQTYVESQWSNSIYYVATLSGYYGLTSPGGYQDITLKIAAADEYELYVNGVKYDSADDGIWNTVDEYDISLDGEPTIDIAVKVTNHGIGHGNGLKVSINGGTDVIGTWVKIRESQFLDTEWDFVPVSWWTFDENGREALGFSTDNWYDFGGEALFENTTKTKLMKRAQLGAFDEDTPLVGSFPSGIEVITGYLSSGVDTGSDADGGIRLRRIEGENLALDKPAERIELTNGNLSDALVISNALDLRRYVDLGKIYRVNKMTLTTGQDNPNNYDETSLRGYGVEVSLDQYRWEEVGIIHEIGKEDADGNINPGGYDNYSVDFPGNWARYIRFHITEVRQKDPYVSEILVYGEGYAFEAYYESPWITFGDPLSYKNIGMIEWDGDLPEGTAITVQTMTKNGADADSSGWSKKMTAKSFEMTSPEPATHFKYRVNLTTQNLDETPVFRSISISYSDTDQPLTYADGFVAPNVVAMSEETEFLYTIGYNLAAGQNIRQIEIDVPGYSEMNYVYSDTGDTLAAAGDMISPNKLMVTLASNLVAGSELEISFNTSLWRSSHVFNAYLYNEGLNDGAGGIRVMENTDEGSATVMVDTIVDGILTDVAALPKVFTPNGDAINDFTVIEFSLAKVETDVMVKIFSTDGSLVTTVSDEALPPSDYRAHGDPVLAQQLPGFWNGEDEDGDLVPPGIYIYQVIAKADDRNVIEGGTVVVAY